MRATIWILGDQLLPTHPALAAATAVGAADVRVVMVESASRMARLPYHRKKLVLLLAAMRHYAALLRSQGYAVDYIQAPTALAGLRQHVAAHQPDCLFTMAAAEMRGRRFQQDRLAAALGVATTVLPNTQFLIGRDNLFPDPQKRVVLETFYRAMRRRWGVLLTAQGEPEGGAWNFDADNRKPLPKGGLDAPPIMHFAPDAITQAVMDEVAARPGCVGAVQGFGLAVTHAQAQAAFAQFLDERLADFGPYEDAMTQRSATLFHALLSPYMNIGLLEPLAMAQAAAARYHAGQAPLGSVEGFVRQVIGWREYMYWQYWRLMPELATANSWAHTRPLPGFFWDGQTDMNCLRHVIGRVLADGYSHHIERLMVITNFCVLAGIAPAAVNAWFWACYVDAYDWVVTPNVIGMGLLADGGQIATKPYIASANYINKMSDYCAGCRFNHKARTGADACPYNVLYWNFLIEHEALLRSNPRFGPAVLGLRNLAAEERTVVQTQAAELLGVMGCGGEAASPLAPQNSTIVTSSSASPINGQ
jgi:deoxyribodipyrimidine photolyase-related protein